MKRWITAAAGTAALAGLAASTPPRSRADEKAAGQAEKGARESEREAAEAEDDARELHDLARDAGRQARQAVRALRLGVGGRLGVSLAEVDAEDAARLKLGDARGALVREVEKDSAAEAAGLRADDVVLSFDGEAVRSAAQLARLVRETPGGRAVALEVSRAGARQRLTATLREPRAMAWSDLGDFDFDLHGLDAPGAPRPLVPPVPPVPPVAPHLPRFDRDWSWSFGGRGAGRLGIGVQDLDGQLAGYFKVEEGVLVTHVREDSAAARAGLEAGDVIVKAGGKAVDDGTELRRIVREAEAGSVLKLGVVREGRALDLEVTLPRDAERRGSEA
jgi:serine protease Do